MTSSMSSEEVGVSEAMGSRLPDLLGLRAACCRFALVAACCRAFPCVPPSISHLPSPDQPPPLHGPSSPTPVRSRLLDPKRQQGCRSPRNLAIPRLTNSAPSPSPPPPPPPRQSPSPQSPHTPLAAKSPPSPQKPAPSAPDWSARRAPPPAPQSPSRPPILLSGRNAKMFWQVPFRLALVNYSDW